MKFLLHWSIIDEVRTRNTTASFFGPTVFGVLLVLRVLLIWYVSMTDTQVTLV